MRRFADRFFDSPGLRLAAWFFYASALLPGVLKNPFQLTTHYDDHYFFAHDDASRITLVRFHDLPMWNPFTCGGIPIAGNPQDETYAPDFLLRLVFGTSAGRHVAVVLFVLLGLEGAFRLARRHGASALGSMAAAVWFAGAGRFFFMLEFGWLNMFGFELLPLAVLALEEGSRSWRWRLVGGFVLGWMLLCAGTYTVPYTLLVLGLLAAFDVLARFVGDREAGWWRPLASLVTIGVVALLFAAVKVFPMVPVILEHPRPITQKSAFDLTTLLDTLVSIDKGHLANNAAGAGFIGLGVIILGLLGPAAAPVQGGRRLFASRALFGAIVFFALSLGEVDPLAPFALLRKLPIYGQLRGPERFTVVVSLFFALSAAHTITWLEDVPSQVWRAVRERWRVWRAERVGVTSPLLIGPGPLARFMTSAVGAACAGLLVVPITALLVTQNRARPDLFTEDPVLSYEDTFRQARGNRWAQQVWASASRGSLQCFEETEFPQTARLRGDLPAEEYPADPTKATVARLAWSPNHIALRVAASAPTRVLINQNYAHQWSSDVGKVTSDDGLLAVDVPSGDHRVELAYRDPWVILGFFITSLTGLGFVVAFVRWLRAR